MDDVLGQKRYGSVGTTLTTRESHPASCSRAAKADHAPGVAIDESDALVELGIKGAIALAALEHLTRAFGARADVPGPTRSSTACSATCSPA
jgi:hypothetical protein